jgi:hypothetical protein
MKAILIDAKNKQVREIEVENDFRKIQEAIGVQYFTIVGLPDTTDVLYVDDEGLINGTDFGFYFKGELYFGNGLILGTCAGGESCSTTLTVKEVESCMGA